MTLMLYNHFCDRATLITHISANCGIFLIQYQQIKNQWVTKNKGVPE